MYFAIWDYFGWDFDFSVSCQQVLGFLVFGSFLHLEVRGIEVLCLGVSKRAYVSESIVVPKTLERKSKHDLSFQATFFYLIKNSLSRAFHLWALEVELVGLKVRFLLSV